MRLFEIIGDVEADVYNELRTIYLIFKTFSILPVTTNDAKLLYQQYMDRLYADKENLHYWILASDRINKLYNEIKQLT